MLLGRPTQLWLGLITLISGAVGTTLYAAGGDPVVLGPLISVWTAVLGGVITFIANQPPVVNEGDRVQIVTPPGQDNVTIEATIPPLEPTGVVEGAGP